MTTVTSLTADRMLAIEAASVVDGDVVGDNLILTRHDGSQINAGSVRGPQGSQGPVGQDLAVLNAIPVLDVGLVNQIRAGRQLTAADFTNMGLSAPTGLWNLSDLTDVSGNGRNVIAKGPVSFVTGINGGAATAAFFSGAGGQALYIVDTGVNDPFKIKTGSFGCWFRSARRGAIQMLVDKYASAPQQIYSMWISTGNNLQIAVCPDGSNNAFTAVSSSDVVDDRWHFGVAVHDGTTLRLHVDGILEASVAAQFSMFAGNAPFNIGCRGADAGNVGSFQHLGRIDEAFVTSDLLSEEEIRNLYCAKIPHTLAAVPKRVSVNVRRRRKGPALVVADFTTQPLRLHNFSGGSLGDEGSGGIALAASGTPTVVAGADGSSSNAMNFAGAQSVSSTDAGLPAALATRSFGCWFKTSAYTTTGTLMGWGGSALGVNDLRLGITVGTIFFTNGADAVTGPNVCDGQWHQAVVVEDNGATDGVKRKLYVDGKLLIISTVMNAVNLGGAARFRIGAAADGTGQPFTGQLDGVFVLGYALTEEQILTLYAKGTQALTPSPKNSGDHVEGMTSANLLCLFDTLNSSDQIDMAVA